MLTAAHATHRTLREVGEILELGVLAMDADANITVWNRWLVDASGRAAQEMIGRPVSAFVPQLLTPTAAAGLGRALSGGSQVLSHRLHGFMIQLPPPSGYEVFEQMQQSARLSPLRSPNGDVVGAVAFIEDVTERVAGEEELRAAIQQAQSANQAKSDFLAAMSHELRTPIGAITGYADLLIDGVVGPVTPDQQDKLQRVKVVGNHLLRIVEEILDFARLDARAVEVELTEQDIALLMREAASAVEPLARGKGLGLDVMVPAAPVWVLTDETKLRQILINLLGNAIKFSSRGRIRMEVEAQADAGLVAIAVTDTGAGIARADLERIFDPFVQVSASGSKSRHGTGLGLSVSRQLARLLEGDISVRSVEGVGSTFVVTLPLREPAFGGQGVPAWTA